MTHIEVSIKNADGTLTPAEMVKVFTVAPLNGVPSFSEYDILVNIVGTETYRHYRLSAGSVEHVTHGPLVNYDGSLSVLGSHVLMARELMVIPNGGPDEASTEVYYIKSLRQYNGMAHHVF